MCVYIYIYIERYVLIVLQCVYIYIYIYTHTYRYTNKAPPVAPIRSMPSPRPPRKALPSVTKLIVSGC